MSSEVGGLGASYVRFGPSALTDSISCLKYLCTGLAAARLGDQTAESLQNISLVASDSYLVVKDAPDVPCLINEVAHALRQP